MRLLRDLGRRRLRTALTILGITIGIWALVVFGSMANKIDAIVAGGSRFYADKITVSARGTGMGLGGPMDIRSADEIARIDGVDVVVPGVTTLLSDSASGMTMGMELIAGQTAGADRGRETFEMRVALGRELSPSDEGSLVTVLGSDLARRYGLGVGDSLTMHDRAFQVVGIYEPTLTMPDTTAWVPLAAAQEVYVESLPSFITADIDASTIVSGLTVFPDRGADPEAVAAAIRAAAPDLEVVTGADFDEQIGSATAIFNAILVGIALISLAVGGLSVINTMAMSVAERTREIGIKRAIGGSRTLIVGELVAEFGAHRPARWPGRPGPRCARRGSRQRAGPRLRVPALHAHAMDGGDRRGLLDHPRRGRRAHPRAARRAPRPCHGAPLRMTPPTGDTKGPIDMTTNALIEGHDLRKTYRLARSPGVEALRGVDITIRAGEMVAIMGPSGSGKSTLMHLLGLLHGPDLAPRPTLTFEGRDMVSVRESERTRIRARRMGFVFQDFNLVPTLTALENVMLASAYAGRGGSAGADGRPRRPGARGPGRSGGPPSCRALRGRAAARRDGARPRQSAVPGPGRRADGEPRLGTLGRGDVAPPLVQPRARPGARRRHPRPGGRRGLRPHRAHAGWPHPGAASPGGRASLEHPGPADVRRGVA